MVQLLRYREALVTEVIWVNLNFCACANRLCTTVVDKRPMPIFCQKGVQNE